MLVSIFVLPHHMLKKTTASSIVCAYVGRFHPQFNEFRAFKVLFRLAVRHGLRLLMFFCSQAVVILEFVSETLGNIMITCVLVWFL